mmetsp:Transcript_100416/g.322068  ORF Transcript_100416/g.322068 Transcript_100416/m.322068 type:complete len:331 (+) Transcript_100416:636-1628(+)
MRGDHAAGGCQYDPSSLPGRAARPPGAGPLRGPRLEGLADLGDVALAGWPGATRRNRGQRDRVQARRGPFAPNGPHGLQRLRRHELRRPVFPRALRRGRPAAALRPRLGRRALLRRRNDAEVSRGVEHMDAPRRARIAPPSVHNSLPRCRAAESGGPLGVQHLQPQPHRERGRRGSRCSKVWCFGVPPAFPRARGPARQPRPALLGGAAPRCRAGGLLGAARAGAPGIARQNPWWLLPGRAGVARGRGVEAGMWLLPPVHAARSGHGRLLRRSAYQELRPRCAAQGGEHAQRWGQAHSSGVPGGRGGDEGQRRRRRGGRWGSRGPSRWRC